MAMQWMPLSTASDPNSEKRNVAGARPWSSQNPSRRKTRTMSKSTGPVTSRPSANNPGRGAGYGKTVAGRSQPPAASGKPETLGKGSSSKPRTKSGGKPQIG